MKLIKPGHKFAACAFIADDRIIPEGKALAVGSRAYLSSSPPFKIDGWWKKQLGELTCGKVKDARFWITAVRPSADPGVLDQENEDLVKEVNDLLLSILFMGNLRYTEGFSFGGAHLDGKLGIRRYTTLWRFPSTPGGVEFQASSSNLKLLDQVAQGQADVFRDADALRLRKALRTFWLGKRMESVEAALHQVVRSLDGVMVLEQGKSRRQFIRRAGALTKPSAEVEETLGEIYDLRSTEEHLNDWRKVLAKHPGHKQEDVHLRCLRQAEVLALHVFTTLLTNAVLRADLRDSKIEAFWKQDEAALRGRWAPPVDLTAVM